VFDGADTHDTAEPNDSPVMPSYRAEAPELQEEHKRPPKTHGDLERNRSLTRDRDPWASPNAAPTPQLAQESR
jgi:hypothetical protein